MTGDEDTQHGAPERGRHDRRHGAREAALQMLYQWEVGRTDVGTVVTTYWAIDRPDTEPVPEALQAFANRLVAGTVKHLDAIDPLISERAEHWRLGRMAIVDRLILRMAVYEFLHETDVPKKVVINEALELAKTFSADDAVGFVNGILDAVSHGLDDGSADGQAG